MLDFYTSLITFEGSRYDWRDLVATLDTTLEERTDFPVAVVSGDHHEISEIGPLEVLIYEAAIALLIVRWERHLRRGSTVRATPIRRACTVGRFSPAPLVRGLLRAWPERKTLRKRATRILNISELHRRAVAQGLASNARWVMTLEDDGYLSAKSPIKLALDLIAQSFPASGSTFIDISDSFSFSELGVENIVASSDRCRLGQTSQQVVRARVPFTNTMCATIMSRQLALKWLAYLEDTLASPVLRLIPIDWHLNRFILRQANPDDTSYFHFDPGLIRQRSIHGS